MTRDPKILVPIATVASALVVAVVLVVARPQAAPEIHPPPVPLVRAVTVRAEPLRLVVRAQGRAAPRAEIDAAAEVAGKIVEVSPSLAAGGFFAAGEVLARIDPRDYELAVERAKADVAQAEVAVAREEAEAEVAIREWRALREGSPPALVARGPQLAEARARLAAARATLEQSRTDLERTAIRAPFAGRVRSENADVGQYVTRGTTIARIYSTDVAEIRVPLPDHELAYVELPLARTGENGGTSATPEAIVSAEFAGATHEWRGTVVRTEGQIDPATQVLYAVVEVRDPYGLTSGGATAPLAVGMFVNVDVLGKTVESAYALPRAAMRGETTVLVVDDEDRLRFRPVEVLRREPERVIVSAGLRDGERVCISPLEVAVDGMQVRIADADLADPAPRGAAE
jgi:RND family efflux transporter MFP subunit